MSRWNRRGRRPGRGAAPQRLCPRTPEVFLRSLLQKSDGSPDPPNRQSEAREMTEIWPPEGATAHFLAVSMCRVTLDTAVDTFATGLYVERVLLKAISALPRKCLLAAVISLPASAGRHRAGVRPNPGTGGGSDRFNRPGWGPSKSLVGPPRHVLRVLNGCVGTKPGFRTSLGDAGHEL